MDGRLPLLDHLHLSYNHGVLDLAGAEVLAVLVALHRAPRMKDRGGIIDGGTFDRRAVVHEEDAGPGVASEHVADLVAREGVPLVSHPGHPICVELHSETIEL